MGGIPRFAMGVYTTGTPPSPRAGHTAVYDPARGRVVVFGGYQSYGSYYLNDVWALWLADISTGVGDGESRSPISLLRPPVPNPARGTITVSYCIANAGRVQLGVYDVSGRLVRRLVDGERSAGTATVV